MVMSMTARDRIKKLHDDAVHHLIDAHKRRTDEPLILAVRYNLDDEDIHLLEILGNFPGDDGDELLTTDFEPSANLRIFGKLHLTLGSPGQLRSAIAENHALVEAAKRGEVVHMDESREAYELNGLLTL